MPPLQRIKLGHFQAVSGAMQLARKTMVLVVGPCPCAVKTVEKNLHGFCIPLVDTKLPWRGLGLWFRISIHKYYIVSVWTYIVPKG